MLHLIIMYSNIAILIILAFIHLYWAMGGTKGIKYAIPVNQQTNQPLFSPSMVATFGVAIALVCFAYFHYSYLTASDSIKKISGYFLIGGGVVFFARAIGEFNYVGLFKKIRNTSFARYDTWLYTPLCLLIAAFAVLTYCNIKPI